MKINFRVTVGAGSITTTTKSITDLIEQASRALYAAKAAKNKAEKPTGRQIGNDEEGKIFFSQTGRRNTARNY